MSAVVVAVAVASSFPSRRAGRPGRAVRFAKARAPATACSPHPRGSRGRSLTIRAVGLISATALDCTRVHSCVRLRPGGGGGVRVRLGSSVPIWCTSRRPQPTTSHPRPLHTVCAPLLENMADSSCSILVLIASFSSRTRASDSSSMRSPFNSWAWVTGYAGLE